MSGDMRMPYEDNPEPVELTEQSILVGGVVVLSLVVPDQLGGKHPALGFRFAAGDGSGFLPMLVLVASDDDLLALPDLVRKAVQGERRAAA